MNKKGFTLAEILVAVLIVAMLAAMAVPMYDKAIEKSRMGEARTLLKKIMDSKMRLLDNLEGDDSDFGFRALDVGMECERGGGGSVWCATKNFSYMLFPSGNSPVAGVSVYDGVCAARCGGDNHNVAFLYLGELTDSLANTTSVAKLYCNDSAVTNGEGCAAYGMVSTGNAAWCNCPE